MTATLVDTVIVHINDQASPPIRLHLLPVLGTPDAK